jgi:hypothetical protein
MNNEWATAIDICTRGDERKRNKNTYTNATYDTIDLAA